MESFSSEMYRTIFEGSPDGVLVVDADGVIRTSNPTAEALFGYAPGELVGQAVDVLVPYALRGAHAEDRRRYMEDPRPRPMGIGMELLGLRKDATEFPVEISLSPLPDEEGAPLVIATVRDVTQRKQLRELSAGAFQASEEERRRIARELHDDTAQRLAGLLVRLRLLERAQDDVAERERRFEEFRREILEAAESVRRVARGLRPPELEDAGIGAAIRAHARALQESSGLGVELEVEPVDHLLAPDAKLVLYRVIQEALSNVLRHSGASRARVRLRPEGRHVLGSVEDDGRGFEPELVEGREGGLGLVGMQERAAMVGGQLAIESRPGEGTRVRVRLPADPVGGVQRA